MTVLQLMKTGKMNPFRQERHRSIGAFLLIVLAE